MRTEYLKTALKIAQTRHYDLAAKELFLSKQAIQQQVKIVEREVGFKLFVCPRGYNRGGVIPTEKGATYLYFAIQALALLEDGKLEAVEKQRPD